MKDCCKPYILLVSKFSSDPQAYTYASSFITALQKLGFQVSVFNSKKNYLPWSARNHDYLPGFLKVINNKIINWSLRRTVRRLQPDVVFFIKAENVWNKTIVWILKRVQDDNSKGLAWIKRFVTLNSFQGPSQKKKIRLINFYPDNPFSFWNGNSNSNVLLSLPLYDLFLIWERSLITQLQAAGCKRAVYFPFAYDETIFNPDVTVSLEEKEKYQSDVCFVGTWDAEREQWLSALKESLPGVRLVIWGNGWEKVMERNALLRDCFRGVAIYGREMVKVFKCSSIVLNFIRKQNLEGHNMRTFEVLASGVFLLTQRTIDQTQPPFQEEVNVACFSTSEELIKKIRYYLDHPDERFTLAQQGLLLAQNYTLTEQLKKMFDEEGEIL